MILAKRSFGEERKRELTEKLPKIIEELKKLNPYKIFLFGSLARGDVGGWSDIDLLVIAEDLPERFLDRFTLVCESLDLPGEVDVLLYTPEEIERMREGNPFIKRALREGVLLYERELSRDSS